MGTRRLKRKVATNKSYKKSGTTDMQKYYLMKMGSKDEKRK